MRAQPKVIVMTNTVNTKTSPHPTSSSVAVASVGTKATSRPPSPSLGQDTLVRSTPYPAFVLVPPGGFINATSHALLQPTVVYVPSQTGATPPPALASMMLAYPGAPITGLPARGLAIDQVLS